MVPAQIAVAMVCESHCLGVRALPYCISSRCAMKSPGGEPGPISEQIRVLCGPAGLCCLLLSDQLIAAGDGGGNLAISDLRLAL
jgi:hypothetical protein